MLVDDRLYRQTSSLYLNSGFLSAPDGYYIYGDFTLIFWVKIITFNLNAAFLTIGENLNVITFGLNANIRPYCGIYGEFKLSNTSLNINQWQHLAYTMQGTTFSIYIDGRPVYNDTATRINYVLQSKVFFGGLNNNLNGYLDDIRIFNKSLSQAEIISCSQIYL